MTAAASQSRRQRKRPSRRRAGTCCSSLTIAECRPSLSGFIYPARNGRDTTHVVKSHRASCRTLTVHPPGREVFGTTQLTSLISMRQHIYIILAAALALLINSVCLCAAATPGCTAASCAAHEHSGTCPAHRSHGESRGSHKCCQTAACSSQTEISADTDSAAASHLPLTSSVVIRVPIFHLAENATRLSRIVAAHSPPVAVPVFLAIRTLLL
jgi:hypothetical protein